MRVLVVFVADFIGFIVFLVSFRVGDDFLGVGESDFLVVDFLTTISLGDLTV
jgi:hypothetical protein